MNGGVEADTLGENPTHHQGSGEPFHEGSPYGPWMLPNYARRKQHFNRHSGNGRRSPDRTRHVVEPNLTWVGQHKGAMG